MFLIAKFGTYSLQNLSWVVFSPKIHVHAFLKTSEFIFLITNLFQDLSWVVSNGRAIIHFAGRLSPSGPTLPCTNARPLETTQPLFIFEIWYIYINIKLYVSTLFVINSTDKCIAVFNLNFNILMVNTRSLQKVWV
jgi:hypothetical protein